MTALSDFIFGDRVVHEHAPWPRARVDAAGWTEASRRLGQDGWTLLGLWGEAATVHLAILDEGRQEIGVLSLACPDERFPSVGRHHAPAIRLERAIGDLHGLEAEGAADTRPWLDHGCWPDDPIRRRPSRAAAGAPYPFLPVEGDGLHRIPVGPVHAGIIEPGHFRFTANGEIVVRLEARLGYVHKGIERLIAGAEPARAARLAARLSGDSTVAYGIAFAQAVEAALGLAVPERALWLRALMAELERLANHLGDIGAICNDAAFALALARFGLLREHVLRAADLAFGHRLMMDRVVPGGVAVELGEPGHRALHALIDLVSAALPTLIRLYDERPSLQDRTVGTGRLDPALARRFGAGGFVGRASGRAFDARRLVPWTPYDRLDFEVPVRQDGDVNARVWIRIAEIEQSLSLIDRILRRLPAGPLSTTLPAGGGEGLALVEGFRGDILAWVRIEPGGRIAAAYLRDPSWFQWPLLEAVIEGNIIADFPLCNKSFNCSYAGHDG